ncbi:IS66 family insertion sequence element accessory protein TnpB [Paenibacillus sp. sgz302251]|uniref:IS66 family insertion sequence element accessory protein TnpB n=1 Tax=Paenibacillus sp. sgz302251 TaxID=3414493 RepID=UPI003C7ED149
MTLPRIDRHIESLTEKIFALYLLDLFQSFDRWPRCSRATRIWSRPFSPGLFVFCNRQRDKLKILYWNFNGFWLFYRRLERGTFRWPTGASSEKTHPDQMELNLFNEAEVRAPLQAAPMEKVTYERDGQTRRRFVKAARGNGTTRKRGRSRAGILQSAVCYRARITDIIRYSLSKFQAVFVAGYCSNPLNEYDIGNDG